MSSTILNKMILNGQNRESFRADERAEMVAELRKAAKTQPLIADIMQFEENMTFEGIAHIYSLCVLNYKP